MPDHPHPPRAAEERISDEQLERVIAYYSRTPTRAWGNIMVAIVRELQSRRAAPERAAVIEECARVADQAADQADMLGNYYVNTESDLRLTAPACANAHRETARRIRSLATPDTLKVVRTVPVGRGQVIYGSETVRVVIIRDEWWGHSAYVAQGIERDIAAQGNSPGEAMRRLAATAEADNEMRMGSGIDVPCAPPHVAEWYEQAPGEQP